MLTVKDIKKLKPKDKPYETLDGDGLHITTRPSGAQSFNLRYRHAGAPRNLTIGPVSVGLAEARRLAAQARGEIAKGNDPCAQKNERKAAAKAIELARKAPVTDTIGAVARRYLDEYVRVPRVKGAVRVMMRPRTQREIERMMRVEILPKLGDRRLEDSREAIEALLAVTAARAPVMANRLFAQLRAMCAWARKNRLIASSPCDGVDPPGAESSRSRVLSDDEIRLFWKAAERVGWPIGDMARWLLISGQRREEAAAMTWAEVDLEAKTWSLAGDRVKNGKPHIIPLTVPMIRLLESLPRVGAKYVFTATGEKPANGFSRAKRRIDAEMLLIARQDDPHAAVIPSWTFHDLRRTAANGMAALKVAPHVIEAVLNHRSGVIRGVAAVYNRYAYLDEKRAALAAWGRRVEKLAAAPAAISAARKAPEVWEFGGGKAAAE